MNNLSVFLEHFPKGAIEMAQRGYYRLYVGKNRDKLMVETGTCSCMCAQNMSKMIFISDKKFKFNNETTPDKVNWTEWEELPPTYKEFNIEDFKSLLKH